MSERNKLVAGNWKMNGLRTSLGEVRAMVEGAANLPSTVQLAICPPATLLSEVTAAISGSSVSTGGQDCHFAVSGAHTGDISADMLKEIGARYVIVGHSERRADHGESDAVVASKALAGIKAGLIPIICVGETLAERDTGTTLEVVARQLTHSIPDEAGQKSFVIAYEPVWAIGTGRTPTVEQVEEVHVAIRASLKARFGEHAETVQLLYGGSVKPANAGELMHVRDVDGALVGGASLKAADFLAIAEASA